MCEQFGYLYLWKFRRVNLWNHLQAELAGPYSVQIFTLAFWA
jgi:hypothetical protein